MTNAVLPMLAESIREPFDDPRYIYEPILQGVRVMLHKVNGKTRLYTRYGNECTWLFPELQAVPADEDMILDGEVCQLNAEGELDSSLLLERLRMTKTVKLGAASREQPVHYVAFDILSLNGQDLVNLPLSERKYILSQALDGNKNFSQSLFVEESGNHLFKYIESRNMKGMMVKRKDSSYVGMRSYQWLKITHPRGNPMEGW